MSVFIRTSLLRWCRSVMSAQTADGKLRAARAQGLGDQLSILADGSAGDGLAGTCAVASVDLGELDVDAERLAEALAREHLVQRALRRDEAVLEQEGAVEAERDLL